MLSFLYKVGMGWFRNDQFNSEYSGLTAEKALL